jgi:hypothetical protein
MIFKIWKAIDRSSSLGAGHGVTASVTGYPRTGMNSFGQAALILNSRKSMYQLQASCSSSSGSRPKIATRKLVWASDNDLGVRVPPFKRFDPGTPMDHRLE